MSKIDPAVATMIANLEQKSGRKLDEWLQLARNCGQEKHGQIVAHLKSAHGLGHGYANLVAQLARTDSPLHQGGDELLEAQYAGKKAGLRPVYERVIEVVSGFGPGLEIAPKKGYVSLRRKKQFALVQPSTAERVDLGINLKGQEPGGRLEASGSFNAMVSHRVRLAAPKDVDAEVRAWLKAAWDAAG